MALSPNDITFVYSGGSNNIDPTKSIGGSPSINAINGTLNNLFSNINREDSEEGVTDYRCFYVFNNSDIDALFNVSIFFESQLEGISTCELGVSKSTDVQILSLSSLPSSGSFTIRYDDYITGNINWNNDPSIFSRNIQDALNNLDVLSGISVQSLSSTNYSISFLQNDNNRNHDILSTGSINLSPSTSISFTKNTEGQPMNSIAPQLPTSKTPPFSVVFYSTDENNRILIGDLLPGDGFPIWIKRTTFGSISNDQSNGFTFRLNGNLVKVPTEQISALGKPCFYYD
jgi:hypothetical protein